MDMINTVIENPKCGINGSERKYKAFVKWTFRPIDTDVECFISSDSKEELEGIIKNRIKNKDFYQ